MKTVAMDSEFHYVPATDRRITVRFEAGVTYRRVLETAAREIERVGAGRIVHVADGVTGANIADARNAFRRRG